MYMSLYMCMQMYTLLFRSHIFTDPSQHEDACVCLQKYTCTCTCIETFIQLSTWDKKGVHNKGGKLLITHVLINDKNMRTCHLQRLLLMYTYMYSTHVHLYSVYTVYDLWVTISIIIILCSIRYMYSIMNTIETTHNIMWNRARLIFKSYTSNSPLGSNLTQSRGASCPCRV